MAAAFSEKERETIRRGLLDAALKCMAGDGIRGVTVDWLARRAGISKGAFYHFYGSKEELFLQALEQVHNEMYGQAEQTFCHGQGDIRQRGKQAIMDVVRVAKKYNAVTFIRRDFPLMMERLPQSVLRERYISDDERIRRLLEKANVRLRTDMDTACTIVHLILSSLTMQDEAGERYPQAIQLMVDGVCDRMIICATEEKMV